MASLATSFGASITRNPTYHIRVSRGDRHDYCYIFLMLFFFFSWVFTTLWLVSFRKNWHVINLTGITMTDLRQARGGVVAMFVGLQERSSLVVGFVIVTREVISLLFQEQYNWMMVEKINYPGYFVKWQINFLLGWLFYKYPFIFFLPCNNILYYVDSNSISYG